MNKKHPSTCCPAAKQSQHGKLNIVNMREKSLTFLVVTSQDATITPAENLLV